MEKLGTQSQDFQQAATSESEQPLDALQRLAIENMMNTITQGGEVSDAEIRSLVTTLVEQEVQARTQDLQEQNAALIDRLYTDSVTGGHNRNFIIDKLDETIEHVRQNPDEEYVLAFIDLDGFKQLNDACGHEEGDYALMDAHNELDDMISEGDYAARLGGDEMLVLMKNTEDRDLSIENIRKVTRRQFWGMSTWSSETPYPIGVSIGTVNIKANEIGDMPTEEYRSKVLKEADMGMYADKSGKAERLTREIMNMKQAFESQPGCERGHNEHDAEFGIK